MSESEGVIDVINGIQMSSSEDLNFTIHRLDNCVEMLEANVKLLELEVKVLDMSVRELEANFNILGMNATQLQQKLIKIGLFTTWISEARYDEMNMASKDLQALVEKLDVKIKTLDLINSKSAEAIADLNLRVKAAETKISILLAVVDELNQGSYLQSEKNDWTLQLSRLMTPMVSRLSYYSLEFYSLYLFCVTHFVEMMWINGIVVPPFIFIYISAHSRGS